MLKLGYSDDRPTGEARQHVRFRAVTYQSLRMILGEVQRPRRLLSAVKKSSILTEVSSFKASAIGRFPKEPK